VSLQFFLAESATPVQVLVMQSSIDKVLAERSEQDDLFSDAMALHARYCDRKDKPHSCVGQATLKRGEVCLDCPLCGKGEHHPWRPQLVQQAEDILAAAGLNFHMLNREGQSAVLNKLQQVIRSA
jgi:hypothetical protein